MLNRAQLEVLDPRYTREQLVEFLRKAAEALPQDIQWILVIDDMEPSEC